MKKLLTAVSVLTLATSAFAGFQGNQNTQQGGFQGNVQQSQTVTTVAQAKKAYDDNYVSLSGYIVNKVGKEKYTFKDHTGTILVEIDDDVWSGLNVTPKTKVKIYGEVDKDHGKTKIDVKRISQ